MVEHADIARARERIAGALPVTPAVRALEIEERLGAPIHLKCELFQKTGSFKPRGALNWLRTASREELDRGLLTVSAGNHAMALAWAAQADGTAVTVVMPEGSSPMKVAATRHYGAEVILHGEIQAALAKTEELRRERGLILVHPYGDERVVAGAGTAGLEIAEQVPEAAVVACPVGGGGLISGIGVALRHLRPDVRLVGVEPENAATLSRAWQHGAPSPLPSADTLAASLGAGIASELSYRISRAVVDEIITVDEATIRRGLLDTLTLGRLYAEPGGAIAVAALLAGRIPVGAAETAVAVVTGGNMDPKTLRGLI